MSTRLAELLLLTALIVRSSSFLFSKVALSGLEPVTLLCLRSLIAFLVLAVIFHKRLARMTKETIFHGAVIGGAFFTVMVFELYGLRTTPASVTSFIENTAIVFVPLFSIFLTRKLPGTSTVLSAAAALTGVAFLTLKSGGFSFATGELLCFGAALTYAAAILITGRTVKEDDALTLGILQNGFMCLFSIPAAFLAETPAMPADTSTWLCVLILALFCSVIGFTLQPVAQKYMDTDRAGLFCAISPLSATLLSMLFLGESMDASGMIGAVCIMASLLISGLPLPSRKMGSSACRPASR